MLGHELQERLTTAESAGLHYVTGYEPGFRRIGQVDHFVYLGPDGGEIDNPDVLRRIDTLVIPPAWADVWIAQDSLAHIQATGKDVRGRKQYRYHDLWRTARDEAKFDGLIPFGEVLPTIRRGTDHDLRRPGLPEPKMLAAVVRLLEATLIRVGDDEYARENQTYGLTTMLRQHADFAGARIRFHFRGKSGKHHDIEVVDSRLAAVIKRSQHLPGERLFEYTDEHGHFRPVESGDVNRYLHALTGQEVTAKEFRTWGGTLTAALTLRDMGSFASPTHAKRNLSRAIDAAAARLGNTRTVARQSYVHPTVIKAYLEGELLQTMALPRAALGSDLSELPLDEARLLRVLKTTG